MADPAPSPRLRSELGPTLPPWARLLPERLGHVQRVAELVVAWADRLGVPDSERNQWLRAVWLHDALRDAPLTELEKWAPGSQGPVELRHGPAAAARAKAEGETDRGVLDAVRYHSVGLAEWDMVGRVLYCADYLEPGRAFNRAERALLATRFPTDPDGVLFEVARLRLAYLIYSGWTISEPAYRFWNTLASAERSSSR